MGDGEKPGLAGEIVDWIREQHGAGVHTVTLETITAEFEGGNIDKNDIVIALLDIRLAADTIVGV